MSVEAQLEALLSVAIGTLLAGIIGFDREWRHRQAGIRTHMLVGLGSSLIVSMAHLQYGYDSAARLASGVISGIGFLGAGVIVQRRDRVHELTTAASIWVVAMIGITAGARLYVLATGATAIGWFVLTVLRRLTKHHVPPMEEDGPEPDESGAR
ncbi:MAG TPA: MgtC/SapB family protein [Aggregatilinea sp.]|jgi:putative Mg2+ transporter-C (MgtC) family protein|uniref:MgtC/SapB family protein n=1 Tax=Aggregatilinea sp. TaxID=2806333 RepID=UPI002B99AF09|nr:MgtC/SapB family protein [Aggregatilinea sp.]HML22311.1 MgtC/SapB family protein [Aggregatilinea sp.]